ncbi:MAG: hypothetical protein Fues2KO_47160 [Fuerstiella sp.]
MPAPNGLNCKLYSDDEGADAGTWDLSNDIVEDLTLNQTKNTGTRKNRGSGEEKNIPGQRVRSIDLTLSEDPTDTFWQLCRDNFESDDPTAYFGIAVCDELIVPASGDTVNGLKMDVICTEFSAPQPLEDGLTRKIKLVPAEASTFEPTQFSVTTA